MVHPIERCPTCNVCLRGVHVERRRQVIELPPPPPVEVIEHAVGTGWCPQCQRWRSAPLELQGQVLGQGRVGVGVASLVAYLRTTLRLPVRCIQTYLQTIHQLTISTGEIVELLHQVRRAAQGALAELLRQARASPILHADETGWREAGQNAWVWAFSTPGEQAVRYYTEDPSRAGAVVKRVLAGKKGAGRFAGHLVSDFSGGYNVSAGPHQRCWVHLCRDLHDLVAAQEAASVAAPVRAAVTAWAQAVRALYDEAQAFVRAATPPSRAEREARDVTLVARVHALGLQYAQAKRHPCQALAKRLLRHEEELFQFVLVPGLSADNNLAERSIRPVVVIRTISGGTQSAAGTQTRLALASLFETWRARGLNPFQECLKLLSHPRTLPQV